MSDRPDEKIRELFEELDQAAPEPPPSPRVTERRPAPLLRRSVVPLGAAAVLLVVFGVASQLLFGGVSEDAGSEDATATTSAAAETITTEAAEGGDGGDGPSETRPPGFALVLADLNLACSAFVDASVLAVPSTPLTDSEYLEALGHLVTPVEGLDSAIEEAAAVLKDPAFAPIAEKSADLSESVEEAASGPATAGPTAYRQTRLEVEELGDSLSDYGALDCSQLSSGIP